MRQAALLELDLEEEEEEEDDEDEVLAADDEVAGAAAGFVSVFGVSVLVVDLSEPEAAGVVLDEPERESVR